MRPRLLAGCLFLFCSQNLLGQSFLTQYNFEQNHTAQYLNPAKPGPPQWTIAPPVFGNLGLWEARNSSSFRGIVLRFNRNAKDKDYFLRNLEADNFNRVYYTVGIIHAGRQFKKNYFTFSINEEIISDLRFPREAMLIIQSLQKLNIINQSFQILNVSARANHLREFRMGWSREIRKGLRIGAAGSFYYGVSNIESSNSYAFISTEFNISTGETNLQATGEYRVNTSGLSFYEGDPSLSRIFYGSGNFGFGIDIGAEYKFNEHWTFSGSALNLINALYWNNFTENYYSEYVDLDVDPEQIWERFQSDPLEFVEILPEVIDSLNNMLQTEVSNNGYVTHKPLHLFIGAEYRWNDKWSSNITQQWTFAPERNDLFIRFGMKRHLGNNVLLHSSLGLFGENRNAANIGLGMEYTTDKFNVSLLSENVMAMFWPAQNFNPSALLSVNFYITKSESNKN